MGKHSLNSKRKYRRKKREQNRQKKKESKNISGYCLCARSSCCFAPSSSSETDQTVDTCSQTISNPPQKSVDSEKSSTNQVNQPVNKKIEKPDLKTKFTYMNDPLYIRFQEYQLIKNRKKQIEMAKFCHEHDFSLSCPADNCERAYSNLDSLIKHVKKKHKTFHEENLSKYKEKSRNDTILESLVEHNDEDYFEDNVMHNENDKIAADADITINFHKRLGSFLLMLREKYKLPSVVIPVVVNEFISMICHHQAQVSQSFSELMRDHVDNLQINEIKRILEQQTDVEDALSSLDSEYKLNKFAKQFLNFVQPLEFKANSKCHKSNDGVLRDYCDGNSYNSNPLFRDDHKALQVTLFFDEFTATNPLGHQIKNYKIGGFYMLLGNLPPKFRSKLYVIQLVVLCLSSCIKKNGFENILEPLNNDLQTLERDGIVIDKADGQHRFFGTVSVVVADNLGAHGLGGFLESFTTLTNCRYCFVSREDMQIVFESDMFNMRTQEMYDEQVRLVQAHPELSSLYGVKRNSPLNSLDFYHVINGMPPDLAHDLFEGVVSEVMTNVIRGCVVAGYFSLDYLNDKILSFPFANVDKRNKPSKVGQVLRTLKVRQSAAQMWCFVRLLPLLIGDTIPVNDPIWECLLCLRDLLFYVCAPAIDRGHILTMKDIIEDFHRVKQQLQEIVQGEEIFTCKSLTVFGIKYWKNSCIISGLEGFNVQFSKVQDCAIINGKPYLICRKLRTADFVRHFHSFVITETDNFELLAISDLKDPYPLGLYKHPTYQHLKLITVKHKILG
ncbi:unnamed protein product [Mytilus coruscus]|uniref:C2H2-type domain-containing protein n=1 Tax=Mytilus coruscus TaxID=42192 RepID=A0A6J8EZY0_MYTCO|nr:unnamed protein product [Mytilus coruscus]